MIANNELQMDHLAAELTRIDLLLRREVRRWVMAGQDPQDDYRGLYISQDETQQLLDRPFGVSWGQLVTLPPTEEAAFASAFTQLAVETAALGSQFTAQGQPSRLCQLADRFGLDRTALDILLLCLAPALDTKYERLYGYLQDNVMRRRPSVRLLLDLLGEPGLAKFTLTPYLTQTAPLFRHHLLDYVTEAPPNHMHWLNQTVQIDETVVAWLLGDYQPAAMLQGAVTLTTPVYCELDFLLIGETTRQQLTTVVATHADGQSVVQPLWLFYGIDEAAQSAASRWLAVAYGQPLLTIALDLVHGDSYPIEQTIRLLLRDAQLAGALPYLAGWDRTLQQHSALAATLLTLVNMHPGPVIMAGQTHWQPTGNPDRRPVFLLEFGMPGYDQRLALWRHWLTADIPKAAPAIGKKNGREATQLALNVVDLANQFGLTSGQIGDAIAAARDEAQQQGEPLQNHHLFASARAYSNPRLSTLARKVTPRYTWAQMVLPADELAKLDEIVAVVKHRHQVLEVMGVGRQLAPSSGAMVLFSGPPGTGKTMAAEVMAATLQLDLYKIELSGVVSKYIGETEKNLERIFSEAANSNAILFFDEADALFGKRSEVKDAHDRYANIEVAYLLQRMELYEGVTILATNLRANLDEAFARRFFRTVEFPFPKSPERLRIWQTLFPPELPKAADVDFALLAKRFDLAGGNIRNVIHSGAVLAASDGGKVTMGHLLHSVRRELQKIGRLVNEEDFT